MLQFYAKDTTTKLGDSYAVNLAVDLVNGVVNSVIPTLALADFDTSGILATFKVGTVASDLVGQKINLGTNLGTTSINDKQMREIMKLLGNKNFEFVVTEQSVPAPASGV